MFEPLVRSLVAHSNPSVRYLALTELTGCDPHDPDVQAARDAIPGAALVSHPQQVSSRGWPLASIPGKLWLDPGTVGEPNPWVTLRVLRVLRCLVG